MQKKDVGIHTSSDLCYAQERIDIIGEIIEGIKVYNSEYVTDIDSREYITVRVNDDIYVFNTQNNVLTGSVTDGIIPIKYPKIKIYRCINRIIPVG